MSTKRRAASAVTAALLLASTAGPALAGTLRRTHPGGAGSAEAAGSGRSVVDWNRELAALSTTPGMQPATIHPTRNFAILQAAEYDAVVSVTQVGKPYLFTVPAPRGARADVAADQAAHDVLAALYPAARPDVDAMLANELVAVPQNAARRAGARVGATVARLLLHDRAFDGSDAAPPAFTPGTAPGDYQRTPPAFPDPVFTGWAAVTPFLLSSGRQFRPAAPPAVSSPEYAKALLEVQSLGQDTSAARTADQTVEAKFWGAPIWIIWNGIAQSLLSDEQASLRRATTVLADLDLALADTTIGLYDAKYTYSVWRPVTAIRAESTAYNPALPTDPASSTWTPLAVTAPDPSFVGAHSALSQAAATVLTAAYGKHQHVAVTSPALTGVSRSFASLQDAATEAGLSRIFAGQHTRLDHVSGKWLGGRIAGFVLHAMGPMTAQPSRR